MDEEHQGYVLRMIAEREERVRKLEARLGTVELQLRNERAQLSVIRQFHAILTEPKPDGENTD